jgi:hypothetical protein
VKLTTHLQLVLYIHSPTRLHGVVLKLVKPRKNFTLPSNLYLNLEIGLLTTGFSPKILYAFLNSFMCYTTRSTTPLHLITLMISDLDNEGNNPGYFVFLPCGYYCNHIGLTLKQFHNAVSTTGVIYSVESRGSITIMINNFFLFGL